MGKLFGTDGVRGIANTGLTPELAYRIGRAAACLFGREHKNPVFIIGRDTRISGQMLEAALAAGICSVGGKAVLAGIVPTPAVAYLTRTLNAQAGVVISASHNPYPDNGIKFFSRDGYKLPDETEEKLEELILAEKDEMPRPTADDIGTIEHKHELVEEYIKYVLSTVDNDFKGMKIVLDCANGAAFEVAPRVLKELGAEVIVLHGEPTGININHDCGSTHIGSMQQAVVSYKADLGIAHDGDADRCLAVDENGQLVDGDQMMVICATELIKKNQLNENTLVTTVMSNIGLHQAIKKAGGRIEITQVSDRYVLERMLEKNFTLGGEQSGHIIFGQHSTTGDGIMTALQFISSVRRSGRKISELAALMTRFPQVLVNVKVKSKEGWQENANIARAIKLAEEELGENGRILVRPSGTEPLIRVMGEGPEQNELEYIVKNIAETIKTEL